MKPSPTRTVWLDDGTVTVIDQRDLPFKLTTVAVHTTADMYTAITDMVVRGAGCIGVCAGYGMLLAAREVASLPADQANTKLQQLADHLIQARPTAVNLEWAVRRQLRTLIPIEDGAERVAAATRLAAKIADEDIAACAAIGQHGLKIIADVYQRTGRTVNIMTHCNAGWLAFVQHGSATAPIYASQAAGIPIHVYVSETRPRNQGARLTAWELSQAGVDMTLIVDNAAGHLLQHGRVDIVIVGSDRTTRNGDVGNKIGTYLKAVAAHDNQVPFYAAMPSSTIDSAIGDGLSGIPIEQRSPTEITTITGVRDRTDDTETTINISPEGVTAVNYGFDVTPARLVTGIITERGVSEANEAGLGALYPDLFAGTP